MNLYFKNLIIFLIYFFILITFSTGFNFESTLYGTNLKVNSPKILSDSLNPMVILKAGIYNDEIKKDILENINPNTTFI